MSTRAERVPTARIDERVRSPAADHLLAVRGAGQALASRRGHGADEPTPGRRPAHYFYREPGQRNRRRARRPASPFELTLVNLIRERLKEWRRAGYPGVTATTLELLNYWRRDGRAFRLFFAQLEAVETIIFLNEARRDFLQGIDVPRDEPSDKQKEELGYKAFQRYACKMATGSGKTTVMGMLAAWSILNKVNDRANARFSDVVLVVCPERHDPQPARRSSIRSAAKRASTARPTSCRRT